MNGKILAAGGAMLLFLLGKKKPAPELTAAPSEGGGRRQSASKPSSEPAAPKGPPKKKSKYSEKDRAAYAAMQSDAAYGVVALDAKMKRDGAKYDQMVAELQRLVAQDKFNDELLEDVKAGRRNSGDQALWTYVSADEVTRLRAEIALLEVQHAADVKKRKEFSQFAGYYKNMLNN